MIKGRYLFKVNGEVVHECYNVITSEGLDIVRNYLAGTSPSWAGSISVGSLNLSAPSTSDSALEFEIARVPVLISSVDGIEIVLTATLGPDLEGRIYEIGVYPTVLNTTSFGFDDKVISTFSEDWVDSSGVSLSSVNFSGDEDTSDGRSGYRNLIVGDSGIEAIYETGIDVTGYSQLDSVTFLYNTDSTGLDRTIRLTFIDDQLPTSGTKYADFIFDGSAAGYKTITKLYGDFTSTGNFNGTVSKITITSDAESAAEIHLDALKFNDTDETNLNFALVSRALVGSVGGNTASDYIIKPSDVEMDIEYRMEIL